MSENADTMQVVQEPRPALRRAPGGKRTALFALLMFLGTALAIVVLGCVYYTVKAYWLHTHFVSTISWDGESLMRDDPDLGYVPTERSYCRHNIAPVYSVYTDNRGGRVGGPDLKAPTNVDVLTAGCSFTWGHGVEDEETYAKVLKKRTGLEVYNAGVASYGTTTALLSMKRYADLKPRVIVYGYIEDHILRSLRPTAPSLCPFTRPVPFVDFDEHDRPCVHPPIGDTKLHDQYLKEVVWNHPFGVNDVHWAMYIDYLRVVRRQAPPFLGTSDPYAAKKIANFHRWASDVARHQRVLEFLFDEMADRAASLNAKLIIFSMPSSEMAPASKAFLSAVKKAEAKHPDRLYFLDTYAALEQLVNDEGLAAAFIPEDGHPTPAAHGRIAGVLEPTLRKLAAR